MVQEGQGGGVMAAPLHTRVGSQEWPPRRPGVGSRHFTPHGFMARCAKSGGRAVEWPPRSEDVYGSQPALSSSSRRGSGAPYSSASSEQLPTGEDQNQTTVYPSNFKLRNEMPIEQERPRVVPSQPAFKMTKPIKMRGDNKWPPANGQSDSGEEQQVREFIKPKKQCKDYSSFFAKHALPANYTGYRAPPGTQHVGCEEDEAVTDM